MKKQGYKNNSDGKKEIFAKGIRRYTQVIE